MYDPGVETTRNHTSISPETPKLRDITTILYAIPAVAANRLRSLDDEGMQSLVEDTENRSTPKAVRTAAEKARKLLRGYRTEEGGWTRMLPTDRARLGTICAQIPWRNTVVQGDLVDLGLKVTNGVQSISPREAQAQFGLPRKKLTAGYEAARAVWAAYTHRDDGETERLPSLEQRDEYPAGSLKARRLEKIGDSR